MSVELRNAQDAVREYAWNWFVYHANQRLVIFRFYLIMTAVLVSGIVTFMVRTQNPVAEISLSVLLFLLTILFWRLDVRNKQLVKIAEDVLKIEEERLCGILEIDQVRIAQLAERKPRFLSSFSNIYNSIFVLSMAGCIMIGALAAKELAEKQNPSLPQNESQQESNQK